MQEVKPEFVSLASRNSDKMNRERRKTTGIVYQEYPEISNLKRPFESNSGQSTNYYTIADAASICQTLYYGFSLARNVVDLLVDFTTKPLVVKGGGREARKFYEWWFKQIKISDLQQQYFRDFYLVANLFFLKYSATYKSGELPYRSLTQEVAIPLKYQLLNPTDIAASFSIDNFSTNNGWQFYITNQSVNAVKLNNPRTDAEKRMAAQNRMTPLDPKRLIVSCNKKADYEPFSPPPLWPITEDVEWFLSLRRIDKTLSETVENSILLVTHGAEPEKGGISPDNHAALKSSFTKETVGRVLIADYTTKAQFAIPQIGEVLDPKKYAIPMEMIHAGLNNVLFGSGAGTDKFSAASLKIESLKERLKEARKRFLEDFLQPEIDELNRVMGFKKNPIAVFVEDKVELEEKKLFLRLYELGLLAPEDFIRAFESGEIAEMPELVENHKEFRDMKKDKLFVPVLNAGKEEVAAKGAGRPTGTKQKQTTKKISAVGT